MPLPRSFAYARSMSFLPLWPREVARHGRCHLIALLRPALGHKLQNAGEWRMNPAVQERQRSYAEFLAKHYPTDTDEQMKKTFEKLIGETGI